MLDAEEPMLVSFGDIPEADFLAVFSDDDEEDDGVEW